MGVSLLPAECTRGSARSRCRWRVRSALVGAFSTLSRCGDRSLGRHLRHETLRTADSRGTRARLRPTGRLPGASARTQDRSRGLRLGRFRPAVCGRLSIRSRRFLPLDVRLSRVLHHELVHAALDAAAPSYTLPAWLNEGLAEWFEARTQGKRHLDGREQAMLSGAKANGVLFSLTSLSTPSFGHLHQNAAQLAYLQSYGMVEFLANQRGERSLREFCERLIRTRSLDRSIKHVYRADLQTLEARFVAELG